MYCFIISTTFQTMVPVCIFFPLNAPVHLRGGGGSIGVLDRTTAVHFHIHTATLNLTCSPMCFSPSTVLEPDGSAQCIETAGGVEGKRGSASSFFSFFFSLPPLLKIAELPDCTGPRFQGNGVHSQLSSHIEGLAERVWVWV